MSRVVITESATREVNARPTLSSQAAAGEQQQEQQEQQEPQEPQEQAAARVVRVVRAVCSSPWSVPACARCTRACRSNWARCDVFDVGALVRVRIAMTGVCSHLAACPHRGTSLRMRITEVIPLATFVSSPKLGARPHQRADRRSFSIPRDFARVLSATKVVCTVFAINPLTMALVLWNRVDAYTVAWVRGDPCYCQPARGPEGRVFRAILAREARDGRAAAVLRPRHVHRRALFEEDDVRGVPVVRIALFQGELPQMRPLPLVFAATGLGGGVSERRR